MKHSISAILIAIMIALGTLHSQTDVRIPEPVVPAQIEERYCVYLSATGSDANTGSRESPVLTYARAIALMKERTSAVSGRIACALRFLPGVYQIQAPFIQKIDDYRVTGPAGVRYLDLSILGEGPLGEAPFAALDASNITVPAGHGIFTLCGRGITVSNIVLLNSSEFGLRLGQPGYRCTNALIKNVIIDGTYSHGLRIGDESSTAADTTKLIGCVVRNTNLMNIRGTKGQFGSAIKLFGARDVIIDSCTVERNWGEAVCINNSSRVEVRNTTVLDNWAPAVYCDVAQDVRVHGCRFISNADTTMFPKGRRGMVGVLVSTEAWDGSRTDYVCERIDVYNNTFIRMAGCLDIWEGTVGFLQRQIIRNVRFAHNTCIDMWTTQGNTSTAFVNAVYSSPFPVNRSASNIFVGNNIFTVDPSNVAPRLWVRVPTEIVSAFRYPSNYWKAEVPGIGTTFSNIINPLLITAEPFDPSPAGTPPLRCNVPRIADITRDARGMLRGSDSTNVGAYEFIDPTDVEEELLGQPGKSVVTVYGNTYNVPASDTRRHIRVYSPLGRRLSDCYSEPYTSTLLSWEGALGIVLID
jgi:hypothetical protein